MRKCLYTVALGALIGGNDLLMPFIAARDYVSARPRAIRTNGMFRMPRSAPPRVGSPTRKCRWEDHQKICDAAESPLCCRRRHRRRHHITKSTRGQPHSRRGGGHKGLVHHRPEGHERSRTFRAYLDLCGTKKDMFPFLFVSETRRGPLCLRRN